MSIEVAEPRGVGVIGGCEPLGVVLEIRLGFLKEQYIVLTAESSLQPLLRLWKTGCFGLSLVSKLQLFIYGGCVCSHAPIESYVGPWD